MGTFEEMAASRANVPGCGSVISDPDYVVVRSSSELALLHEEILGEREIPLVGLTLRSEGYEPVLRASDIRGVVGPAARIFLITSDELLQRMRERLGSRMCLWRGAVRVWWPGAARGCDPSDHPLVMALDDEDYMPMLEEFAREFDLSRPRVRARVRLIEDSHAFCAHELASAQRQSHRIHERLRDSQILCHVLRSRAEAAEAGLQDARRRLEHD